MFAGTIKNLGSMVLPASLSPLAVTTGLGICVRAPGAGKARVNERNAVGTCTWNAQRRAVADSDESLGRRLLHLVGSRRVTEFIPAASPLRHP